MPYKFQIKQNKSHDTTLFFAVYSQPAMALCRLFWHPDQGSDATPIRGTILLTVAFQASYVTGDSVDMDSFYHKDNRSQIDLLHIICIFVNGITHQSAILTTERFPFNFYRRCWPKSIHIL